LSENLPANQTVKSFTYRATAPLFVNEEIQLNARRSKESADKYSVAAYDSKGVLAMKGEATIGELP
jgi:hydroxyacyl-ACP dehydratase HTD2-like protein with hotdog domain